MTHPRSQPGITIDTDSPEGNAMAAELSKYRCAHAMKSELPSSPDARRPVVATHPVPEGAAEDAPPAIQAEAGYDEAQGFAASLRQQACWIDESRYTEDLDADELRSAADFIDRIAVLSRSGVQNGGEPAAWQWRGSVDGRGWSSWLPMDDRIEDFKRRNAFNLNNGTYEIRPLYAVSGSAAQAARMEELEKFLVSVREIISECGEDFHVCAVCGQQDDDATKDSDLLLLLKGSLEATTAALASSLVPSAHRQTYCTPSGPVYCEAKGPRCPDCPVSSTERL